MSEQGKSRRKIVIANLPPALSTRARNKGQHPGAPDIPKPRRTPAEVTAAKAVEDSLRQADQDARIAARKDVAEIEDRLLSEDNDLIQSINNHSSVASAVTQPRGVRVMANNNWEGEARESEDSDSAYKPEDSGEDEVEVDSDMDEVEVEGKSVAKKSKARKNTKQNVRAAVQSARSFKTPAVNTGDKETVTAIVGSKRKLTPLEETRKSKKTKKPEVGGIAEGWQERGRPGSTSTSINQRSIHSPSTRAHSHASSTVSSHHASVPSEPPDSEPDGIQTATFADDLDDEEHMELVRNVKSNLKIRRWQHEVTGMSEGGNVSASTGKGLGTRDGFSLVHKQDRITAIKNAPLVTSKRTTRTGKETSKPRNTDIPEDMRDRWNAIFVPLARELAGTLEPWAPLSIAQVQSLYERTFPESNYVVTKGDVFVTIASYRIHDWHSSLAAAAVLSVKRMIEDNREVLPTAEDISIWVKHNLGDGNQNVPFHWEKWPDTQGGEKKHRYCNPLILMTLAAHIGEIKRVPEVSRSKERPIGALILSIQAVERALKLYATGTKASAKPADLWFSKDNWGDAVIYDKGKPKHTKRATKYLKVINDFGDERWSLILNTAEEYYIESQPRERGDSAARPIEVEDDGDEYYIVSD